MEGERLGTYRLGRVLGTGGMGTVYVAQRDGSDGFPVALKVLHPHLLADGRFVERFAREAEIGRRVDHPCVVRVLDSGRAPDAHGRLLPYLAMEYIEGQGLDSLTRELGRVPEALCRHVATEVARGLEAIHTQGIVHRDIKPSNVRITQDETIKILDLGVARRFDEAMRLSETGQFVGSLLYAAPEQFRRSAGDIDARADLHAVGLMLYEMATAVQPFEGGDMHQTIQRLLGEVPAPPSDLVPELSPFFDELVLTLLAKEREHRLASAQELCEVLRAGESGAWWREREAARAASAVTRVPRIRVARDTALHGRRAQIQELRQALQEVQGGTARVVLLEGEAGAGKTRLLDSFLREQAEVDPPLVLLFGAWAPGGAAAGHDAIFSALREHFGEERLERELERHLGAAPRLVPTLIAAMRGVPAPAGSEPLTREGLRSGLVHVLRSLASRRPLIVALDDLHFSADEGRGLFASLSHALEGEPILLLATHRPGLPGDWVRDLLRLSHVRRIQLTRLSDEDIRALLADALQSAELAHELQAEIVAKSDGNPFFVFELLRGLHEGGTLSRRDDGSFVAERRIVRVSMPATIRDLVARQLEDLEAQDRDLLDIASCCGHEFDPLLVGQALGLERIPVLKRLARLESARGLVRSAGPRCAFEHHLVQEVLYEGLPRALRAGYHAALWDALETASGALLKEPAQLDGHLCVELARHGFQGGQGHRAVRYLDEALDTLEQQFENEAAVDLATLALDAMGALDRAARLRLLLRKAGWLDLVGRRQEQRALLAEALALTSEEPGDAPCGAAARARVLGLQAALDLFTGMNAEALAHANRARDLARSCKAASEEVAALGVLGTLAWRQGDYPEAARLQGERIEISRQAGDVSEEVEGRMSRALAYYVQGQLEDALSEHETALGMAQVHGLMRPQGAIHSNIAITLRAMGRLADAEERLRAALAIARETGDRRAEANITGNLGNLLGDRGRWREALSHHERQRRIASEVFDRRGEAISTLNAGLASISLGLLDRARRLVEEGARAFDALGDRRGRAHARAARAQIAEAEGDLTSALEHAQIACQRMADLGVRGEGGDMLVLLGRLLLRAGRASDALLYLDEAVAMGREMEKPSVLVLGLALRALAAMGDPTEARLALDEHSQGLSASKRMLAHHTLWRASAAGEHLEAAHAQLVDVLEHADPEDRARMLANVPLFAAVHAAVQGS